MLNYLPLLASFALLFGLIFSGPASAAESAAEPAAGPVELVEVNLSGQSTLESESAARAQITRDLLEQAARQQIIALLGEKKASANGAAVQEMIRQSARFIPFSKASELRRDSQNVWSMTLQVRLSLADLRQLLTQKELLRSTAEGSVILPVILFGDAAKSQRWAWWQTPGPSAPASLVGLARRCEDLLREEFIRKGLYVLKPVRAEFFELLPPEWRGEASELNANLAPFFRSQFLLSGEMQLGAEASPGINLKLSVKHAQTGRFVGEVVRVIRSDLSAGQSKKLVVALEDSFRDLAQQVAEAVRRGTAGAEVLELIVTARLSAKDIDEFKLALARAVPQTRSIRERSLELGRAVFELEFSGAPKELAGQLKALSLTGYQSEPVEIKGDRLLLNLRRVQR